MKELTFESSLTEKEITENFKNISFFDGLMQGLNEALAYEKGTARAKTYARKRSLQYNFISKSFTSINWDNDEIPAAIDTMV